MRRECEAGSDGWGRRTRVMRVVSVMALLYVGCVESPAAPRRLPPVAQPEQPSTPPPAPAAPTPEPPPAPTSPAPTPLKLRVAVATTGVELDPNGYTLVVYDWEPTVYATDPVDANGSTVLDLAPGSYIAHLTGIAPNCTANEPETLISVFADSSPNPAEQLASLGVTCLAIPPSQGLRVTTVNTGTSQSALGFQIEIMSEDGAAQFFMQSRSIGANESVTMPSPPGAFFVYLRRTDCIVESPDLQRIRVDPNQMASLTFTVSCPA